VPLLKESIDPYSAGPRIARSCAHWSRVWWPALHRNSGARTYIATRGNAALVYAARVPLWARYSYRNASDQAGAAYDDEFFW